MLDLQTSLPTPDSILTPIPTSRNFTPVAGWLICISVTFLSWGIHTMIGTIFLSCPGRQIWIRPKIKTCCSRRPVDEYNMLKFCLAQKIKVILVHKKQTLAIFLPYLPMWDNHNQLLEISHLRGVRVDNCVMWPKTWWNLAESQGACTLEFQRNWEEYYFSKVTGALPWEEPTRDGWEVFATHMSVT